MSMLSQEAVLLFNKSILRSFDKFNSMSLHQVNSFNISIFYYCNKYTIKIQRVHELHTNMQPNNALLLIYSNTTRNEILTQLVFFVCLNACEDSLNYSHTNCEKNSKKHKETPWTTKVPLLKFSIANS